MIIEADRAKLTEAAASVESFLTRMKNCMDRSGREVQALSASWEGGDFTRFFMEWERVSAPGSVFSEWQKTLENYAALLRFAEEKYRKAQQDAVNRADALQR